MAADPQRGTPQTSVGKFLAKRGALLKKQFKPFTTIKCEYGTLLTIQSLVLSADYGKGPERTYGIKFEHEDREQYTESCLVDFDELVELLHAIKHIFETARSIVAQDIDYTEIEYSTRDSLRVGFFQSRANEQQVFFDVAPGGSMMFISFDQLRSIFESIKSAREHLIAEGAET